MNIILKHEEHAQAIFEYCMRKYGLAIDKSDVRCMCCGQFNDLSLSASIGNSAVDILPSDMLPIELGRELLVTLCSDELRLQLFATNIGDHTKEIIRDILRDRQ